MFPAKQQEIFDRLKKFGWVMDAHNFYVNDSVEGLGVIFRHVGNVAIVYPDGSMDRAGDQVHSKHMIRARKDWYSPAEKKRAEQRAARWLDDFHKMVIKHFPELMRYAQS